MMHALLISILNFTNEIILLKIAACLLSQCKLDTGITESQAGVLASLDIVETLLTLNELGAELRQDWPAALLSLSL